MRRVLCLLQFSCYTFWCATSTLVLIRTTVWQKMDRNDPHKYRNSKFKTQSKKSSRVGAEGKKRLQRGQKKPA